MALRSKFTTNHVQKHGLTHFLAIPLVTPTSKTQLSDSFKCLWDDLSAIGVPADVIRPLGLLNVTPDIPLSLKTSEHMDKATEILRKASVKNIQPTIHESSTSENLSRHSSGALPTFNYDSHNSMAPPSVSISRLFCRLDKDAKVASLNTIVYDPTHILRDWSLRLAHTFRAAGLSPKRHAPRTRYIGAALENPFGFSDATICLLKIPRSTEVIPCKWNPGRFTSPRLYSFDARGLLERYKNHVWIENAPLERVSICKIGLQRLGVKELPEVVSVPLY